MQQPCVSLRSSSDRFPGILYTFAMVQRWLSVLCGARGRTRCTPWCATAFAKGRNYYVHTCGLRLCWSLALRPSLCCSIIPLRDFPGIYTLRSIMMVYRICLAGLRIASVEDPAQMSCTWLVLLKCSNMVTGIVWALQPTMLTWMKCRPARLRAVPSTFRMMKMTWPGPPPSSGLEHPRAYRPLHAFGPPLGCHS